MRIGILTSVQHSMFSGGVTNASIAIAESLQGSGHYVDFINYSRGSQQWWDDCTSMKGRIPVVRLPDASGYDLVIEIDRFIMPPTERRRVGKKSVWIHRHPFMISETENVLFPTETTMLRDLSGVSEVWLLDTSATRQDIETCKALFGLPVRVLPFLWSSTPARIFLEEVGDATNWQKTAEEVETKGEKVAWNIHCTETNTSNTSSAVLPLTIFREINRRGTVPLSTCKIHNTDKIKENKFFIENTFNLTTDIGISGELMARQRLPAWTTEPFSIVLSHIRFKKLRPALLDALWCGIPLVHNSPLLSHVPELEWYAYESNDVIAAANAVERLHADWLEKRGAFSTGALEKVRAHVEARWGSSSVPLQAQWDAAVRTLMGEPVPQRRMSMKEAGTLRVGFCDMWENFQPDYNFFTLLLTEAASKAEAPFKVVGQAADGTEDLVIFGPFGGSWQQLPAEIPKVHFTGENTLPLGGPGVILNLGFQHLDMTGEDYLRFPLWLLYIDWFSADAERLINPLPIPLERCTKVFIDELPRKKKFCAFVATNPNNPVRNTAFHWLSEYKQVDSAGRLFNNVGSEIFASMGGGGGEQKKLEFLKDYKFSITYENSSSSGYCTEKYLHAKAAGCVPIYWGDPTFERDFDPKGCIDARKFRTPEELVAAVEAVDTNDSEWLKRFAVPALDSYKVAWARRTFAELARRIFAAVGYRPASFPRFLCGATAGKVELPLSVAAAAPAAAAVPNDQPLLPMMVTYTNSKFFQNLNFWLTSLAGHYRVLKGLTALVFLASDIAEESLPAIREKFPFVQFQRVPEEDVPAGFPDFWDPQHYGFKLWIYNHLATREDLAGRLILYTDVASFLCRWPVSWLKKAHDAGICLLEDSREENARWCSAEFQEKMGTTAEELSAYQRLGGLVCFRAGSDAACTLFAAALAAAQDPVILTGPKWAGVGADGRPYGHRHDQSILSILSLRQNVPVEPLDTVYCDTSLRVTHKTGRAIYVHRGNFQIHKPFTSGIDEVYCINLNRRKDRMERLLTTHPDLSGVLERWPAIDGRELKLTPAIAKLLRPNDFFWKKAVTGCALSHLGLWWKLATEQPDINSFLILEDDVKFRPGWLTAWNDAQSEGAIPDDADIVYLGGVLPPNREGFEAAAKERVNEYVVRVAPNQCFGQKEPTRYFHFCAYAYVLTRKGAAKVIGLLQGSGGYWTSADHILCNPIDVLTTYILDPMVAGCYQDDDPKYATSNFNDFSRVDSFDSDLWNNNERFTEDEIAAALIKADPNDEVPIAEALADARKGPGPSLPPKTGSSGGGVMAPMAPAKPHMFLNRPLIAHADAGLELSKLYEYEWLMNLFGKPTLCGVEPVSPSAPPRMDCPMVIFQGRDKIPEYDAMLQRWNEFGATFYILHLSDEWGADSVASYDLSGCLGVIRTYQRADLSGHPKVLTIPLGYHWTLMEGSKEPLTLTPRLPFRLHDWSFVGTGWMDRMKLLSPLVTQGLRYHTKALQQWNDPDQLKHEEYISILLNSIFVPCPEGMNAETFRFYEALECGAIPVVVETEKSTPWIRWLQQSLPIRPHKSWEDVSKWMRMLLQDKEELETYRTELLTAWSAWRGTLQGQVQRWIAAVEPSHK